MPQLPPRRKPIRLSRIHDAVADLPEETQLCASLVPDGVRVQLMYEGFSLARGYLVDNHQCPEITHLLDGLPHHLVENDYLWSAAHGDFDLCGRLWISTPALRRLNRYREETRRPVYVSVIDALMNMIIHNADAELIKSMLYFTPTWSQQLIETAVFATYDDFLGVMESNFPMGINKVFTVRAVDNVAPLYEDTRDVNEHNLAEEVASVESLIVVQNDLTIQPGVGMLPDVNNAAVAEIYIEPKPTEVVLDMISLDPDRFGRLRPVITYEEADRPYDNAHIACLRDPAMLVERDYRVGDIVKLSYVGPLASLGPIVRKGDPTEADIAYGTSMPFRGRCHACNEKLIQKHGGLYCENPACSLITADRLYYACSPAVLALPFDRADLNYLTYEGPLWVPSLLTFDQQKLTEVMLDDDATTIRELCLERIDQLHGTQYSEADHRRMQGRFLDSMSIIGLYRQNIRKLLKHAQAGDWKWTDLPRLLKDSKTLLAFGMQPQEVRTICNDANLREDEIQAYAAL